MDYRAKSYIVAEQRKREVALRYLRERIRFALDR